MNYSQRMDQEFTNMLNSYTRCGKISRIRKAKADRLRKAFRLMTVGRYGSGNRPF